MPKSDTRTLLTKLRTRRSGVRIPYGVPRKHPPANRRGDVFYNTAGFEPLTQNAKRFLSGADRLRSKPRSGKPRRGSNPLRRAKETSSRQPAGGCFLQYCRLRTPDPKREAFFERSGSVAKQAAKRQVSQGFESLTAC